MSLFPALHAGQDLLRLNSVYISTFYLHPFVNIYDVIICYILVIVIVILFLIALIWSRDSLVCVATRYGLDDKGVRVRVAVGSRIFSKSSRPAVGSTQPPIQWVRGLFPRR
jgi:hypothetical protein